MEQEASMDVDNNKQFDLMDRLNMITMQSFPEANPFPTMRVMDDGALLYQNEPARFMLDELPCEAGYIPVSWQSTLNTALEDGQACLTVYLQQGSFDLLLVRIDQLCVNIYGHDVSEREHALRMLQQMNVGLEQVVKERTSELSALNLRLSIENKCYKALQKKLSQIALYDDLTGLANRRRFYEDLQQASLRSKRDHGLLAVMFIDLNKFKQVNDQFGHQVGDQLLGEVATRLHGCVRKVDMLARLGGDEFAVVLTGFSCRDDLRTPARRIIHALASPFKLEGQVIHISGSIGISLYPSFTNSTDVLVNQADQAMYAAKSQGGGFAYYDDINQASDADQMQRYVEIVGGGDE